MIFGWKKKCFSILGAFWSEPGLGSARNGFLAKNCVGYANSQPKRLSGRPLRGQNVFLLLDLKVFRDFGMIFGRN